MASQISVNLQMMRKEAQQRPKVIAVDQVLTGNLLSQANKIWKGDEKLIIVIDYLTDYIVSVKLFTK